MMRGVVMVEERSAQVAVTAIAHSIGVGDRLWFVPYEGKADLERSFVRKISAWRQPADVRFLVSRDNDGADCTALKRRLSSLVPPCNAHRVKIRLVMQELESWYLGDFDAVEASGLVRPEVLAANRNKAKFREPDRLTNASELFHALCGAAARAIAPHLSIARNRSVSLRNFVVALNWVAEKPDTAT